MRDHQLHEEIAHKPDRGCWGKCPANDGRIKTTTEAETTVDNNKYRIGAITCCSTQQQPLDLWAVLDTGDQKPLQDRYILQQAFDASATCGEMNAAAFLRGILGEP